MTAAADPAEAPEARFRAIFRRAHADHPGCLADEWLERPCRDGYGRAVPRPVVWSRRNGPWRPVDVLWVGAAPGNAGGRGSGEMGAHATRIPFGGDVAGANLDVLLGSAGLHRNRTFIVAALNQLPDRGGGEPSAAEMARPVGEFASSLELLRETLLAAVPRLVVALGNVALRATVGAAAGRKRGSRGSERVRLPSLARLRGAGLERGRTAAWPAEQATDAEFEEEWREIAAATGRSAELPSLLWLTHPSAQNMSPFAGEDTAFHRRMLEAQASLRAAVEETLGGPPPSVRPAWPERGIYALPEWRRRIGPYHARLDALWRERGV